MRSKIVIPPGSDLYQSLNEAAHRRKQIFLTGIPGVGKSLYVQQLVLLAQQAGRSVHLFQYDVVRTAFEHHPDFAAKYSEINGVTQPMIRKAVGIWSRQAVLNWSSNYSDPEHLLVGEVPLIGNRLIELVQPHDDSAEALLADQSTLFMIPVPSRRIREKIVARRQQTIANPQHQKEKMDAQINVLRQVWAEAHRVAVSLGLAQSLQNIGDPISYDPDVYAAVYEHLCRHRHFHTLHIDLSLTTAGSVYDWDVDPAEVRATIEEAAAIILELENRYEEGQIAAMVDRWAE